MLVSLNLLSVPEEEDAAIPRRFSVEESALRDGEADSSLLKQFGMTASLGF